MTARDLGRSAVTVLLCHVLTSCGAEEQATPTRPDALARANVILISIDTLNRNALRAFDPNAEPLPALDEFAGTARRFQNAHSTASWTLPAHASLMTGLYPDRHGATTRSQMLSPLTTTMAECFERAGYETVGFTEGGYLHSQFGFAKGFARYDQPDDDGDATDTPWKEERRTGRPFERAIRFVAERPPDGPPLYLFLHTYLVHDYFKIRPWAVAQTPRHEDRERTFYLDCLIGKQRCDDEDWARLRELYDAGLARVDAGFAKLLAALEKAGLRESSLIVLLSDHGEGFDPAHARVHHAGRLHADLIRIPLLIAGPGVPAGDVETPVSLVDVMPALLERLGLQGPAQLDGVASEIFLRIGSPAANRSLFAMEHYRIWGADGLEKVSHFSELPASLAVIDDDWWYIQGRGDEELYAMSADPKQRHDRSAQSEEALVIDSLRESSQGRSRYKVRSQPRAFDDGVRKQLRSLGYIE